MSVRRKSRKIQTRIRTYKDWGNAGLMYKQNTAIFSIFRGCSWWRREYPPHPISHVCRRKFFEHRCTNDLPNWQRSSEPRARESFLRSAKNSFFWTDRPGCRLALRCLLLEWTWEWVYVRTNGANDAEDQGFIHLKPPRYCLWNCCGEGHYFPSKYGEFWGFFFVPSVLNA